MLFTIIIIALCVGLFLAVAGLVLCYVYGVDSKENEIMSKVAFAFIIPTIITSWLFFLLKHFL